MKKLLLLMKTAYDEDDDGIIRLTEETVSTYTPNRDK